MSKYDIIQSYMMVGGIPYYLQYFEKEYSLSQNIDRIFFAENAILRDEYDRLFSSLFVNAETIKKILKETLIVSNKPLVNVYNLRNTVN